MRQCVLFLAITCCFLAACKEGWTDEYKQAYLESCGAQPGMTPAQSDKYCRCLLDTTMRHYKNIDEVIANKDSVPMTAARQECRTIILQP